MMRRRKVYLDYDNCLVNSTTVHLEWCNKNIEHKYNNLLEIPDQMLLVYYGEKAKDFWYSGKSYENIRPMAGAIQFFEGLTECFDVTIVTMNLPEHIYKEKFEHAKYYFGVNQHDMLHVGKPYNKFLHTTDGILVDDYTKLIEDHVVNNNQHGVVFNLNNQHGWAKKVDHELAHYETTYASLYATLKNLG